MIPISAICKFQAADRRDAAFMGLRTTSYHLLCVIASDESQTLGQLAKAMGTGSANLFSLANTLERKGMAERLYLPNQRRARRMQITVKAMELLTKLHLREVKPEQEEASV